MFRNTIKDAIKSVVIIVSGIAIPVGYHTHKENKEKENKENN